MSLITIKTTDPETGETLILAEGELGEDAVEGENGYYFMPNSVNKDLLQINAERSGQEDEVGEKTVFDVISSDTDDVIRTEAAWRYETVEDGWEDIAGKYGFSITDNNGIITELDGEDPEAGYETGDMGMQSTATLD